MSLEAEPTPPPLFTYVIESQNADTVHIRARNWMVAFGMAMNLLRLDRDINRLAIERLPNGVTVINDIESGRRYIVRLATAADFSAHRSA